MADKPTPTQAERQAQIRADVDESNKRILSFIRGAAKAITTDLPGFIADVADRLAGDTAYLGEKNRSEQMFSKLTGSKKDTKTAGAETAESLGSVANPGNLLKAIIVPAFLTKSIRDIKIAERALEKGISPEKVEKLTGIYALPENISDGILRTVIDPRAASLNPKALTSDGTSIVPDAILNLPDVLNFPQLYSTVPSLRDVKILGNAKMNLNNASYNTELDVMQMGPMRSSRDLLDSVLHETQHGIQNRYNMNQGSNPVQFFRNVTEFDTAKNVLQAKSLGKSFTDSYVNLGKLMQLEAADDKAVALYKQTAGEAEARAVEKMLSQKGPLQPAMSYYGDPYDINRLILGPEAVKKVDEDIVIRKIIEDALKGTK